MIFSPRPYQKMIVDHILAHKRCAVWAGMGLGKTASTLEAIRRLKEAGAVDKVLILAPLRVAVSTWPDEVAKWENFQGLRVSVSAGTIKHRLEGFYKDADIYITNYENLLWMFEECMESDPKKWPFDMIVADESTRIKGARSVGGGKRARVIVKVAPYTERIVELTGTPAPNGLEDLWGQFYILDSGKRLGKSFTNFHERFFRPQRIGNIPNAVKWIPLEWSEAEIKKRAADIALTVNAEDWFDIKEPLFTTVEVELPNSARKLYKQVEKEFFATLNSGAEIEPANAAVKTNKLLQIASGAVYTDDDGRYEMIHFAKEDALRSIIAEAAGSPVLVAYNFRHEADRILRTFYGSKILDKNPETIRAWNRGEIPILLAHPASCGHGLSMQDGGQHLVFYGTGWSLEEHEQIIERIGPTRQAQSGHPRPVFVYTIVTKNTVDEAVQERIKTKRSVLDVLLERKRNADRADES